jgi:hypothetical protein
MYFNKQIMTLKTLATHKFRIKDFEELRIL